MNNEFSEYRNLILKELERLNTCYQRLDDKVNLVVENMLVLKTKMALYGAVVGLVVTVVVNLIMHMLPGVE
jgi:tetrahydromethanopterin S-methyltransferase subunit G